MKKYLNKGLLYEWFNAAKVPILIGLITWGIFARSILSDGIVRVKTSIGTAESNNFNAVILEEYFILGVIFLAIYIFANGNNKRNTTMFLCSGPHTKKQIKVNELICLLITLGLFILTYIYIAVTVYIGNNELISIVNGYQQVILIEAARILLFGMIGILLMIEIDLLFSNSIIAYFGMIALFISTFFIFYKFRVIMSYFGSYGSSMDKIFGSIVYGNNKKLSIFFFGGPFYSGAFGVILRGIAFSIIVIIILMISFNFLEKRAKLETTSKIFSCKFNENFITAYLSIGTGAFISLVAVDTIFKRYAVTRESLQLPDFESIKMLSIDLIILITMTFISYKIFRKIIKIIG